MMPVFNSSQEAKELCALAQGLGVSLSSQQTELLQRFMDHVQEWNRKLNLTGVSSRQRMLVELVLDSLVALPSLPQEGRVLDVGSGAGFPGIPLKIGRPALHVYLAEANAKKVRFLRHVVRVTGLTGIEIRQVRVEQAQDLRNTAGYDVVTTRAVAPPARIVPWCLPYVADGGRIVLYLGTHLTEYRRQLQPVLPTVGLRLSHVRPYRLPGREKDRHIMILEKCS